MLSGSVWTPPAAVATLPPPDDAVPDPAYRRALERIYGFSAVPRSAAEQRADRPRKLPRVRALLERLGNPQAAYPSVLVAGTKGKGSTAAILVAILAAAGLRVGRYTQPHLVSWRERTWLGGAFIDPAQVAARLAELEPALAALERREPELGRLTTFEVGTALTLLHFRRMGVELAVLEVGVGGRDDATNAAEPLLSVVTSVSLDHAAVLGADLASIAAAKAGVLRPGRPAVLGPQPPEALAVLEAEATRLGTPLVRVGCGWRWEPEDPADPSGGPFRVLGPDGERYPGLRMPLLGRHQRENATAAVAAANLLRAQGYPLTDAALRAGLASVEWPGRLQVLARAPTLVLDGAHNRDSALRLREALGEAFRCARLWLVLGVTEGKDVAGLLEVLAPPASGLIVTRARHARALDAGELASALALLGRTAEVAEDAARALALARRRAGPDDLVLVTGSLFLVGEALLAFEAGAWGP